MVFFSAFQYFFHQLYLTLLEKVFFFRSDPGLVPKKCQNVTFSSTNHDFAASVQKWHNVKFIADFPFKYYYENR
jgi:hypothetical protein